VGKWSTPLSVDKDGDLRLGTETHRRIAAAHELLGIRGLRYGQFILDEIQFLSKDATDTQKLYEWHAASTTSSGVPSRDPYRLRDVAERFFRNESSDRMETLMSTPHITENPLVAASGFTAQTGCEAIAGKKTIIGPVDGYTATINRPTAEWDEEADGLDDGNDTDDVLFDSGNGFDQDIQYVLTYPALQRLNKVTDALRRAVTGQVSRAFDVDIDENVTRLRLTLDGGEDLEEVLKRERLDLDVWVSDDEKRVVLRLIDALPEEDRKKRGVRLYFEASGKNLDETVEHLLVGLAMAPTFPNHLKNKPTPR
jgi:hypothetical protein